MVFIDQEYGVGESGGVAFFWEGSVAYLLKRVHIEEFEAVHVEQPDKVLNVGALVDGRVDPHNKIAK